MTWVRPWEWARTAPLMTRCSCAVHGAWQPISPLMPACTSVPQAPSSTDSPISSAKSSTPRVALDGSSWSAAT